MPVLRQPAMKMKVTRTAVRHHPRRIPVPLFYQMCPTELLCATVLLAFWLSPHLMMIVLILMIALIPVPIHAQFPVPMALSLLFCLFPRLRTVVTSACLSHRFSSSTSIDRELSPSPCLLSSSDDANSGDCETVAPPDGLRDLIYFTFNNLSSCNLPSIWLNSFLNQWRISICPGWLYIWWSEPPLSRIYTLYIYVFWTIWLIHLCTV